MILIFEHISLLFTNLLFTVCFNLINLNLLEQFSGHFQDDNCCCWSCFMPTMTGGCMDEIAFVYITRHVTDSNRSGCIISDGIDEVQYDLYNITSCY